MWISPNHPNPPQPVQGAPQETGERLATFQRGRTGEELRVTLAEYEGHPFISLRVWAPGPDGRLWPVKGKGVSVRIREVAELADALADVAEQLAAGDDDGPQRRRGATRHHQGHAGGSPSAPQRPAPEVPAATPAEGAGEPFDEFAGDI